MNPSDLPAPKRAAGITGIKPAELVFRHLGQTGRSAALALALSVAAGGSALAAGASAAAAPYSSAASTSLQAMRMEETPEAYQITLAVPEADAAQLRVTLKGQTLQIASGRTTSGAHFEQSLYLPAAAANGSPTIQRANGVVVISVPKGSGAASASPAQPSNMVIGDEDDDSALMPAQLAAMQREAMQQLARLQKQMGAALGSALDDADSTDPFANFPGFASPHAQPRAGAVTVEDDGKNYLIRARNLSPQTKLNVSVENGNVLKVTTSEENTSAGGQSAQTFGSSESTQMVTLPTKVLTEKMTSQREGNDMVITLPKG